ncbi:hypothetical protein BpHYR1_053609 [Brachionus plicatilis]|uniref:Uncharacterized protein n=1 Tax=Brachionus plicatilis TaxID=10195 RepID=A0A3M7PHA2_BRAPC|nr:hypothetical protein BpHYR1_053609 [Brachionus plicatilis]
MSYSTEIQFGFPDHTQHIVDLEGLNVRSLKGVKNSSSSSVNCCTAKMIAIPTPIWRLAH